MVINEEGKKIHCPQTIEAVRKYIDPNAEEWFSKGKRKYLMPMDKKMREQLLPLSMPYPKNEDWVKIDRNKYKNDETRR